MIQKSREDFGYERNFSRVRLPFHSRDALRMF